jgi:hypothetical protein
MTQRPPPVRRCPHCGREHRLSNPHGLCARCVMAQALAESWPAPPARTDTFVAYRSARCQYCGRAEPLFGPEGDLPSSPLAAAGWASSPENGRVVWTCPACRPFTDLLCEDVTAGPPGSATGGRSGPRS